MQTWFAQQATDVCVPIHTSDLIAKLVQNNQMMVIPSFTAMNTAINRQQHSSLSLALASDESLAILKFNNVT